MSVAFISHSDCGRHDTGWQHPEHTGRLRAITRALRDDAELFQHVLHHEARHATASEIALAHGVEWISEVERLAAGPSVRVDADTVISEGSWDAARASVGAVLDGIDLVFAGDAHSAFCAVRPPGHHALRDRAMGFCLFGNVAIGAHYARRKHGIERVLIVDWDVHHGNGTQALVEDEPGIRFVSMHQWPWYPGTGAAEDRGPHGSVVNVPMPAGRAADEYVEALTRAVDRATDGWSPELILVSAGFDSLRGDPLGGFTLELEHVALLTRQMMERAAAECGGRLVSALEGGYDPPRLGQAAREHLRTLARL